VAGLKLEAEVQPVPLLERRRAPTARGMFETGRGDAAHSRCLRPVDLP